MIDIKIIQHSFVVLIKFKALPSLNARVLQLDKDRGMQLKNKIYENFILSSLNLNEISRNF